LREGFETVLFLGAIFGNEMKSSVLYGGLLGILLSLAVTFAFFKGMRTVPIRLFFKVTGVLVLLIAAGILTNLVGIMQDISLIPVLKPSLFDIGWLLSDSSDAGIFLKALFGYTHSPSLLQVVAYVSYFGAVFLALFYEGAPKRAGVMKNARAA